MKYIITLLLLFFVLDPALAGIMPSRSRIIYKEEDRNQSLMLANTNDYPVIVQTWVDNGEGSPDMKNIPFLTVPPVFYLEPSAIKGISIMHNDIILPEDKESLYWLNILEIPPQKKNITVDNKILVGINMQIKIFYRPKKVKTTSEEAIKKIQCRIISKDSLQCINPSSIHISAIGLTNPPKNDKFLPKNNDFLFKPYENKPFIFSQAITSGTKLELSYITDFGEQLTHPILVTDSDNSH